MFNYRNAKVLSLVVVLVTVLSFMTTFAWAATDTDSKTLTINGAEGLTVEVLNAPTIPAMSTNHILPYVNFNLNFAIEDYTGSGTGWTLAASAPIFTNGAHSFVAGCLKVVDTQVAAQPFSSAAEDIVLASDSGNVIVGTEATTLMTAAANAGMGGYDVDCLFKLNINPADNKLYAGNYTSTITLTFTAAAV